MQHYNLYPGGIDHRPPFIVPVTLSYTVYDTAQHTQHIPKIVLTKYPIGPHYTPHFFPNAPKS